jgi:hypothetical protein
MKYAASFASIGVIAVITAFTIQENTRQPDKQMIRSDKHVSKDSTCNREPVYGLLVKPD